MDFCSLAERIYSFQKKYISRVLEDFVSPLNELHFHGDRRDPAPIIVFHLDYKPSLHLVSLIQVTPSSLLLSLIYPRGLCFKIKSNFTRAVERPSVCAIASIRLHSGLGTSTGSAEPVAALNPGGATAALPESPLRILRIGLLYL